MKFFSLIFVVASVFYQCIQVNSYSFIKNPGVTKTNLITIGPGGLTGFYTLGVASFIKDNYNISQYSFLGASAGSWNALLIACKKPNEAVINDLFSHDIYDQCKTVSQLLYGYKNYVINNYETQDFELDKLYISVSILKYVFIRPMVVYNFTSIEDAVDGCFFSSYIPTITGDLKFLSYKKPPLLDGGIGRFPPKDVETYFDIYPSMWGRKFTKKSRFTCPKDNGYFKYMYDLGYDDSAKNKNELDTYFHKDL